MMEQPTLGSLIERVSLPRFGWPVRRMQKGYDGNTMQYALTLLIDNPNKTNFGLQIVKEEDSEYYRALKAGEFCRMAENGRKMIVEWWSGYRVSSYESVAGQFR